MTYLQPLFPLILLIALADSIRCWRSPAPGTPRLLAIAVWALVLLSLPVASRWIERPLESFSPPRDVPAGDGHAIVVLSSAVYPPSPPLPTGRLGNDTFERCQYAAWLYRNWRKVPVLASGGGSGALSGEDPPYSITMREALEREGVPETAIWVETRSRSTYENALYSSAILRQKGIHRIVLVTEAYHMLRAEKCFEKQGIAVTPAACGFRSYQGLHWSQLLPNWEAIAWDEDVLHEVVGLFWYRARGWI